MSDVRMMFASKQDQCVLRCLGNSKVYKISLRKCESFLAMVAAGMFMTVPVMAAESRLHTISVRVAISHL